MSGSGAQSEVHIRVFKRNGKKCYTTIEPTALKGVDVKTLITKCSKKFCCGGSYDKDEKIIKFTGDIRDALAELVVQEGLAEKECIKIHGF